MTGDVGCAEIDVGVAAVRILAKQILSEGWSKIRVDPRVANTRAIRAFEKAGFRGLSEQSDADTLVMEFVEQPRSSRREMA